MTIKDKLLQRNENPVFHKRDWVIAKYKPEFYNSDGVYTLNEWTSCSDIIKSKLSVEDYLKAEDAYVRTARKIMQLSDCRYLTYIPWSGMVDGIPASSSSLRIPSTRTLYNKYRGLREGQRLNLDNACDVIRLSLRELVDCTLINNSRGVSFMVGFDYYLHISCQSIDYYRLEKVVRKEGLYLNRNNIAESVNYHRIKMWLMDDTTEAIHPVNDFYYNGEDSRHAKAVLFLASVICDLYSLHLKVALLAACNDRPNLESSDFLLLKYRNSPILINNESVIITNSYYEWSPCPESKNSYYFYRM